MPACGWAVVDCGRFLEHVVLCLKLTDQEKEGDLAEIQPTKSNMENKWTSKENMAKNHGKG